MIGIVLSEHTAQIDPYISQPHLACPSIQTTVQKR